MAKKISPKYRKAKGTAAENELIHNFWDNDWACIRVAGSGSTKYPAPDILSSRGDRKIVMEVKVTNEVKKYFTRQEINDLKFFGERFGAESWVGVKFAENQWYFIVCSELNITKGENYLISLIEMKRKGCLFEEMINLI